MSLQPADSPEEPLVTDHRPENFGDIAPEMDLRDTDEATKKAGQNYTAHPSVM
jgi:hypothetical protein